MGAVGTPDDGHTLLPTDGWRSGKCLDKNWDRYLEQILEFDSRVRDWNADHGERALGGTIFTSGIGTGWESFQITETEMNSLAQALLERYPLR